MFERFFGKSESSEKPKVETSSEAMLVDDMGSHDQTLQADTEAETLPTTEGPAVFKANENVDQGFINNGSGWNRPDIYKVGESKHLPKID